MGATIKCHPLRKAILAEIHARPYIPVTTPRVILQQAFLCKPSTSAQADLEAFSAWCEKQKLPPPHPGARHHMIALGDTSLTWERHTEFITLTWDRPPAPSALKELWALSEAHILELMSENHALISAVHIDLIEGDGSAEIPPLTGFDANSLCLSTVKTGKALIVVDFRQDQFGATKFAVYNNGLDEKNCGILLRRLLEIETYRVMSLYGFERLKAVLPKIASIEKQLVHLTGQINNKTDLDITRKTLEEITDIAADLTNLSASSQYRFSATRAYYSLVNARLKRLNEDNIPSYSSIEEFLAKRLAPAMRSCENIETRIKNASEKLDRATRLLRTKVDIQMQLQSHQVLDSMNERALMQYRLQTTVEGLSIAAVSYYVVGLIAYLAKGLGFDGFISPARLTAISVPIAIVSVWYIIQRIRARHQ